MRNRLIAALSGAVVLTEARHRSSVLGIAHHATRIGRPVGAVPGPVTSSASDGVNGLLRERTAHVVIHAGDAVALLTAGDRAAVSSHHVHSRAPSLPGHVDTSPPDRSAEPTL